MVKSARGQEKSPISPNSAPERGGLEEQQSRAELIKILEQLGGIWKLPDLKAPIDLRIPSATTDVEENGILVTFPIPDNYFPAELQEYLLNHHDRVTLQVLSTMLLAHMRSRLAQLGLDGELDRFIWHDDKLHVIVNFFSRSSRDIAIEMDQGFCTLFTPVGAVPIEFDEFNSELWFSKDTLIVSIIGGDPEQDYGIMSIDNFTKCMPPNYSYQAPSVSLAYVRLKTEFQMISPNTCPITMPQGPHSLEFRPKIDSQLSPFSQGSATVLIGETVPHINFEGPAILRPEILGIHRQTGKRLLLRQTNSPIMGFTNWPIRVEITTMDGNPLKSGTNGRV